MKKIFTFILIFEAITPVFAQRQIDNQWVMIGLRANYNSTWLLNKNQLNNKGVKYQPSWGWSAGGMAL